MRHLGRRRARESLILAVAPVISGGWCASLSRGAEASAARRPIATNLIQVRKVTIAKPQAVQAAGSNIIALPLNAPPINGFTPQVVIGMSDEWDNDDFSFAAHASDTPGASHNNDPFNTLPLNGPPQYATAIFDTGSSAHLITLNEWQNTFDLPGADRDGAYEATLAGAGSATESVLVNDAAGFYMTGFGNASTSNVGTTTTISVAPGTLRGHYNVSVLSAEAGPPDSILPNIAGSAMIGQYQAVIRNTRQRSLTVNGTQLDTPQVDLTTLQTHGDVPGGYSRIDLTAMAPQDAYTTPPSFFPSLDDINKIGDNPTSPTNWAALFSTQVSGNHTKNGNTASFTNQRFLFDTGAQVTVLSQSTAGLLGIHLGGENPDTPDFFVEVGGVGGVTDNVPGFYIDQLGVNSTGGGTTWTHVPVLVFDIIDPGTGSGFVPGIIGMNLFTDRDLIINGGTTPFVGVSPRFREWVGPGGGNWSDNTKWGEAGVPNAQNLPAVFRGNITAPSTIAVNGNFTVGSLTFDSANAYTLDGPAGRITLQMSPTNSSLSVLGVPASIWVGAGSHTINAPMTLASDTTIEVEKPASTLTISADVTATTAVTKLGAGTLQLKNLRGSPTAAADVAVNAGTLRIAQNGGQSGTSRIHSLTLNGGKLDLKDNDLVVTNGDIGQVDGASYSGLTGMVQVGRNGANGNAHWSSPFGILTSMSSAASGLTSLGIARASQVKGIASGATATWSGQTVTGSDVLIMYTYGGDANLDGKINVDDYGRIDASAPLGLSGWYNGDFNYDGKINVDDYGIIDFNIAIQGAPLLSADGGVGDNSSFSAVPEPAGLAILLAGTALMGCRRRRPARRM